MGTKPGRGNAQFRLVEACVFCGAPGPLTEEHVYGKWLREHVYAGNGKREVVVGGVTRSSDGGPFTKTVKIVCYPCNNEWMSGMETAVEPLLLRMFAGAHVELDATAQRDLARWAFKTVCVFPYVDQRSAKVPEQHRAQFHETDEVPDHVTVRIGTASMPSGEPLQQLGESSFIPRPVQVHHNGRTAEVQVYSGRFRLMNVVFEVVGQVPNQWALQFQPSEVVEETMPQIWPVREPVIQWPPASSIDVFGGLSGLEAGEEWEGQPTSV